MRLQIPSVFNETWLIILLTNTNNFIIGSLFVVACLSLFFYFKGFDDSKLQSTWFKVLSIRLLVINTLLVFLKFLLLLYSIKRLNFSFRNCSTLRQNLIMYSDDLATVLNYNLYGTGLLILCFITSIIALTYLGDRNIFYKLNSMFYFYFFLICTTILTSTSNLLVMFISFECIFLPSVFFVYTLGYVKKVDKTIMFLVAWTLFGSFLVFFGFLYIYITYKTLNYPELALISFSKREHCVLYFIFFFGFGIKIPTFPFYHWLTKVHVEAPAGFSMFLSGFLVKTALYCFYFMHTLLAHHTYDRIVIFFLVVAVLDSSYRMWSQLDLKRLVALATIQEMNMILLGLVSMKNFQPQLLVVFILIHGFLSTLMFFLVDQIQIRTQTRNILQLSGFAARYPGLRTPIWIMLLIFLGIPYSAKFILEFYIGFCLVSTLGLFGTIVFFFLLVVGSIGFAKCWLLVLYGVPSPELSSLPHIALSKTANIILIVLISCMVAALVILYV